MTNNDLSLEISTLRDLVTRVGRGTFDGCDPDMLRHLDELAGELKDATSITRQVLANPV